jgi:hypothetical protein
MLDLRVEVRKFRLYPPAVVGAGRGAGGDPCHHLALRKGHQHARLQPRALNPGDVLGHHPPLEAAGAPAICSWESRASDFRTISSRTFRICSALVGIDTSLA